MKNNKRFKLPNGFGSIYKLTGNRRNPYVIKKFIDGKQVPIGYKPTYASALSFLCAYNDAPDFYGNDVTFEEIYHLFRDEHFPTIKMATVNSYINAFKHCTKLYKKPFKDIKLHDLQETIKQARKSNCGYASQKKIRNLFHMLYKYAMKNDIVSKDYSLFVIVDKDTNRKERVPFTIRQVHKLAKQNTLASEIILMLIYSGLRPSEMLRLKSHDCNWKQSYFIVKESKTEAGRNRMVTGLVCA